MTNNPDDSTITSPAIGESWEDRNDFLNEIETNSNQEENTDSGGKINLLLMKIID